MQQVLSLFKVVVRLLTRDFSKQSALYLMIKFTDESFDNSFK